MGDSGGKAQGTFPDDESIDMKKHHGSDGKKAQAVDFRNEVTRGGLSRQAGYDHI